MGPFKETPTSATFLPLHHTVSENKLGEQGKENTQFFGSDQISDIQVREFKEAGCDTVRKIYK